MYSKIQSYHQLTKDCILKLHLSRNISKELKQTYKILEERFIHDGSFVLPSYTQEGNILKSLKP